MSWFYVLSGLFFAALTLADVFWGGRSQRMPVMNWVWPLTVLWAGWLGLYWYFAFGRAPAAGGAKTARTAPNMDMNMQAAPPFRPTARQITLGTLHCGAGCTLADILGEWFTFFVPLYIAGSFLAGQWMLDYALALVFGLFFQFFALRAMRRVKAGKAFAQAFKIDFLSLTAWQIGMYAFMAFVMFCVLRGHMYSKTTWEFWFIMQLAMGAGFLASYPVNKRLMQKGVKPVMDRGEL